ncbi:MAG: alkaline phosphatase [Verrucomicrobia bacterium]|jgi:alkaline phosphatase|nr:alkaline phosphatase [Verrucomicrobiota bacterium]MBT5061721.1 alkaline phosphatase [Verrucomicrobiota bacterium]MBT5479261.1 alkaline phosphatase [Verrucomicrobiota bacterium]MBT6237532.1 alkaline phosphatase [Verrucomicrobiota bacterium]MBT6805300.1 alkaline phosphatase [Verrucomicrobiota bacterium]
MKFPFYPLIAASIYLTLNLAQCETREPASYQAQQQRLNQAIQQQPIHGHARNIILFIGDGMGISTITAARILEGQQNGNSGEENTLSWESFPHTALIKVYNSNQQTPDSAGTMSAIMTGHKTKAYTFGYDQDVVRGDHTSVEDYEGNSRKVTTLLERFEKEGKSTGIVTTARITHATPAACYAHSPERNWEHDADMKSKHKNAYEAGFKDIARQLIEFPHGDGLEVALGGGRGAFIPETSPDHEDPTNSGKRLDGRNLINEWLLQPQSSFVYDHAGLDAVDTNQTSKLLGLFEPAHMQYEIDRAKPIYPDEPSLEQMSIKALEVLRKNEKGFFLMIEAGRIDHAHHAGNAHRALMETIRLSDAVRGIRKSLTKQEKKETLILVTADHSHTFTIAGYPTRGNPILGLVVGNDSKGQPEKEPKKDALGLPYTTLGYVNGGGYTGSVLNKKSDSVSHGGTHFHGEFGDGGGSLVAGNDWKYINVPRQSRPDLSEVDVECENYVQEAGIPMGSETHGGEDVVAYAEGPMAHLISGVHEQNFIFHVMRFASDASQFVD